MFKKEYLNWLKETLEGCLPAGYTIKIVEEFGRGGRANSKFNITCYVKFGAATKQTNISDRINQPVIFSIFSEADNFKGAEGAFNLFFLTYSKTKTSLTINNDPFDLWHFYNSPTIQSGFDQIGEYQRANLIMTGVVSYSKEKIIGVKYYLDDEELQVVNPQTQYITNATTPQSIDANTGKVIIEGANNSYTFTMLLDKSALAKKFLDCSITGAPYGGTLKIDYGNDLVYMIPVRATTVINTHDSTNGDNILQVTLMPE